MTAREDIELACLEEVRAAVENLPPKAGRTITSVGLEGTYPDTSIVVQGKRHRDNKGIVVRFPIWDETTGGVAGGNPMPSFIGTLVLAEVLEA